MWGVLWGFVFVCLFSVFLFCCYFVQCFWVFVEQLCFCFLFMVSILFVQLFWILLLFCSVFLGFRWTIFLWFVCFFWGVTVLGLLLYHIFVWPDLRYSGSYALVIFEVLLVLWWLCSCNIWGIVGIVLLSVFIYSFFFDSLLSFCYVVAVGVAVFFWLIFACFFVLFVFCVLFLFCTVVVSLIRVFVCFCCSMLVFLYYYYYYF